MTFFINKPLLKQLNPFLELNINHLCTVCFDYHNTNIFPVNILALGLKDNGEGNDYYENLQENQRLPILADHVYFLPCNLEIRFDITQSVTLIAIHFNLTFFYGLDIFSGSKQCVMRHAPELVATFRNILAKEEDLKAICELKSQILQFCVSCWPNGVEHKLPTLRKYESIFRYVREHGNADLTVGDLAELSNQRQDTFSRSFSRDIGKSPKEFLQNDLINKIITHLIDPHANIKEIAAALSFSSEFNMSRFFKKHTGMSPSEYRNKFRP